MSTEIEQLIVAATEIIKKANLPDRHSFFQIEKFIIGKEPTAQAQLWQIVREIQIRVETFDSLQKQLEDAEDTLELFDVQIERLGIDIRETARVEGPYTAVNIKEFEINIRKLERDKKMLVASASKVRHKFKSLMEEMSFLVAGFDKIVAAHGEVKPLDDIEAQKEMWNEKLLEEFNLRVILQRPIDPDFVKTVLCLGDDAPVKQHVVKLIDSVQKKMIQNADSRIETKPKVKGN